MLNFYAFTAHGESEVLSWIAKANSYGINVHIWMQVFYSGGSWVNPVSGGSPNQAYFNEVIEEAKYYAGLPGVAGVHFDYLRYPGNAYQTTGGTAAITEFVKQATTACREVNPNIIMSAAVMPETTDDIYYSTTWKDIVYEVLDDGTKTDIVAARWDEASGRYIPNLSENIDAGEEEIYEQSDNKEKNGKKPLQFLRFY